jgi:oligopeptide/dipeptide ABC transporter ATP-binding protein
MYGAAVAVENLDLDIARGSFFTLLGPSGSGKTTTLRLIAGFEFPDSGSIRLNGQDVSGQPPNLRDVNTVFQDYALFPHMTLLENVAYGLLARKVGREDAARRAGEALEQVRLGGLGARKPGQLSGGQRQRLTIAMALLPQPRLILADEPTTALDVTIQAQVLRLLHGMVRDKGVSLLFTTHDLGVASEICDRIVVMYAGQEVELAPTRSFFATPRHPYTARLLRSLPNEKGEVSGIPGGIPALVDPPGGCRFHPRCERASELCRTTRPPPVERAPGHVVRCHHPLAEAA